MAMAEGAKRSVETCRAGRAGSASLPARRFPTGFSHDGAEHPGHELFGAEPVCFRAGLSAGSGFKNQLKDALSQFRYRCLTIQDLTAINVHIICHSPV